MTPAGPLTLNARDDRRAEHGRSAVASLVARVNRRGLLIAGLVLTLVGGSWLAWHLRLPAPANDFVGPPRSDYTLDDYHLVVLDELGAESFMTIGPYLARDPNTESMALDKPRFTFPAKDGKGDWNGFAEDGWIDKKGTEVRLSRGVILDGPKTVNNGPVKIRTDRITVLPKEQTAHTDAAVTITRDASILTGVGMDANMKTKLITLLSTVRFHNVPPPRR